ncbi:MAG: PstS family phosphate ABC transporter substrate-binding protein [Candidatus Hydrogenedentes bacterium]|nr:PstS family phosphate ABC transporter substrate-binding protein [Candidatus Hydrogenedentota bacterium]
MRTITVLAVAAVVLATLTSGCGPSNQPKNAAPGQPQHITIKGSDTMVQLVTAWVESYMKTNPSADISVTGGGSGTGISALLNKTTDICSSSREMSEKEITQATQNGVKLRQVDVARDGLAVIVNPANPLNELTLEQLGKIYTGASAQWKDLGGPDGEIIVLSRESSSGTYVFFQEHVLKKQDYSPKARLLPTTSAIVQSVGDDALAIGYVGLGYAAEAGAKVKVLSIKADAAAPGVVPSEKAVLDGSYSIARPLYFYVNDPANKTIDTFIQFCLGAGGQKIVREIGYVPVK